MAVQGGLCFTALAGVDRLYSLGPNNCNQVLGFGEVVPRDELDDIDRGLLFNFHAEDDTTTNPCGISLGKDSQGVCWGAGSNTTPFEIVPAAEHAAKFEVKTNFKMGDNTYGVFTLASSFGGCRYKYQKGLMQEKEKSSYSVKAAWKEPVIRKIDPVGLANYH